jgi:hypothetical protein
MGVIVGGPETDRQVARHLTEKAALLDGQGELAPQATKNPPCGGFPSTR